MASDRSLDFARAKADREAGYDTVRIGDPAGMIPTELTPRLPEVEMKRAEWDHIPSAEELDEPATDGWELVKATVNEIGGALGAFAYYERYTGPLSGYGPAMTDKHQVHASQDELEAAKRLLTGRDPGADFEEVMDEDPGRIQKLVDEVRKDFKAEAKATGTDVDEPKSIME